MTAHAIRRIANGARMPGLLAVSQSAPIGPVIDDIVLIAECSQDVEWDAQIYYLPFR